MSNCPIVHLLIREKLLHDKSFVTSAVSISIKVLLSQSLPVDEYQIYSMIIIKLFNDNNQTRQSKHCGFSIYIFDNSKSKPMVRLVRAEKMVLSGLVFARKIARMILIQNIQGLMGPLMINMAFKPFYM